MNKIYVNIDFTNGILEKKGIDLITGDYASTEIEFTFEREDGRKVFEIKSPSGNLVYADEIIDNKVLLTAKDENENNVSLFDESGDYIFEVSLYVDNSKLTSVYGKLPVQKEQVEIEGEVVEKVLPLFEQLMQELNTAITETNNLNITGSKIEHTTTITITKKDGTSYEVEVLDGEQGPQGEPGQPGAIKMVIVDELPQTGSGDTLYFVPKEDAETSDLYDEYAWVNNAWERLGEKQIVVDLTDYVKNTDYSNTTTGGVIKINQLYGTGISNGILFARAVNYSDYNGFYANGFISKQTLENVITGKGLTTKSYVDSLVGDIGTTLDSINGESVGD